MDVLKFANPQFLNALWGLLIIIAFYVYVARIRDKLLQRFGHIEIL